MLEPEYEETPLTCSFPYQLHFMEMSFEEAQKEFFAQFDEHVSKEFRAATNIDHLLRTKGTRVLVPHNWEGVKGFDLLEPEFKDNLPDSLKPKARPINPRLFAAAKTEFERLCKYLYKYLHRRSNSVGLLV